MIDSLSLEEFRQCAKHSKKVAVFKSIEVEDLSAVSIYEILSKNNFYNGILLEDLQQRDGFRNSFIGFNPIETLELNQLNQDPLEQIRKLQAKYKFDTRKDVINLITAAAGFVSYDAIRFFEEIPDRHQSIENFPLVFFSFFSLSITFSHEYNSILISTIVDVEYDIDKSYRQAELFLNNTINILRQAHVKEYVKTISDQKIVRSDTTDNEFIKMVEIAKEYIIKGDAFQVVLSRTFTREYSLPALEIYKTLRKVSPAPFMFYIPIKDTFIIGASPERFIQVYNRKITANPIAGTRMRNPLKDHLIKEELLNDEKELAEHMMLVDLTRNDVGSVSEAATVEVNELLHVQHYSHVTHITSKICGVLKENYDALDALRAAFPVGTLSGAPKIRAMEIIDELEKSKRNLYGGAICRLDGQFDIDSCVAIRMACLKNGKATIRTGAGIVFDSNPSRELLETYEKANPMLDAIAIAHGENE